MTLRFTRGTLATVSCGRRLPDSLNDVAIYGSHGRIVGYETLWEARQGTLDVVSETVHTSSTVSPDLLASYVDQLENFQAALAER